MIHSLKFNSKMYGLTAVKSAVADYKDLANFKIVAGGKYLEVKLDKVDPEIEKVIDEEFCNYVLSKVIQFKGR